MKKIGVWLVVAAFCWVTFAALPARAQDAAQKSPGPEKILLGNWNALGAKVIAMAEDWPEDKYGYRPNDQVRTFGQILLHLSSWNYGATYPALGKSTDSIENDPKEYKSKAEIVAFVKKSFADGAAALEAGGDDGAMKNLDNWVGTIEHSAEHFGDLVVYYRNNGVVPPESRPKK